MRSRLAAGLVRLAVFHLVLLVTLPAIGADDNWNRFRGPNGSGVATEATPPVVFGPEKNARWKVDRVGSKKSAEL